MLLYRVWVMHTHNKGIKVKRLPEMAKEEKLKDLYGKTSKLSSTI